MHSDFQGNKALISANPDKKTTLLQTEKQGDKSKLSACRCRAEEPPLTYAAGLGPAPRPVGLAEPPGGSHQHERGQAGEGDGRAVREASVLPPALRGYPRISAEHGCNGQRDNWIVTSLLKSKQC